MSWAKHLRPCLAIAAAGALLHGTPAPADALQSAVRAATADASGPAPTLRSYRSEHYTFHTNLGRQETVPYGRHMDAVYHAYARRFAQFGIQAPQPLPLYLLRTHEDYLAFMASHGIDARNSGGMFFVTHTLHGLATWTQGPSRDRTFRVLQHEGFHQFAFVALGPRLPVWANEGVAQYFEDAVVIDGRMRTGQGSPERLRRAQGAIRDGKTLPLTELLALSPEQWTRTLRRDRAESGVLYAQAWSFAWFLIHGDQGAHTDKFLQYLARVAEGQEPALAMHNAFGRDGLTDLEPAWKRWVLDHPPNPLHHAAERMDFVAAALRYLSDNGQPAPDDIDELRQRLTAMGFILTRDTHGVPTAYYAHDPNLYRYRRADGHEADLILLAPSGRNLPPRVYAPGLDPEPTLDWERVDGQGLVTVTRYR
ncbi:MAG: DUF1570 domain-containing protein [Planctomycetota bacterium]